MRDLAGQSYTGILTAIFVFLLPFVSVTSYFPYGSVNAKYFFITGFTLVLSLIFSYLVISGRKPISIRGRWLLISLVGVLAVYYLSGFAGVFPSRSLWSDILRSTGLYFLTTISLLAFLLSELLSRKDWGLVFKSLAVSMSVFVLSVTTGLAEGGFTFGNQTFAGAYLLLSFILTLVVISKAKKDSGERRFFSVLAIIQFLSPLLFNLKVLANPSVLLSNPINILGFARSSSAVVILAIIFIAGSFLIQRFIKNKKSLFQGIWTGAIILGVFVSIFMLFTPGTIVQDKYIEASTAARIIVWEEGILAFKEKPLLGWGPENFRLAHEKYFNPDLHLEENIGEIWFDRAHNIVVDTLVSVGIVGAIFVLGFVSLFIFTLRKAYKSEEIGKWEFYLLGMLPFFHFVQMQTAFDTTATYAILAFVAGYVLSLEKDIQSDTEALPRKTLGTIFLLVVLLFFNSTFVGEWHRQYSVKGVFAGESYEEQVNKIKDSLGNKIDFETLRLTSASFVKGFLDQAGNLSSEQFAAIREPALDQLDAYNDKYVVYLERAPEDYRARMNYAYILFTKSFLGENSIAEAQEIIENSYDLSPGNPLTLVMDSLASFYSGDVNGALQKVDEAIAINPRIKMSLEVKDYLETQIKNAPRVGLVRLENL